MSNLKLKTYLGRWLSGFALPRYIFRVYLQILTLLMRGHRSYMVVLSSQDSHAYSACQGVRALGKKVLLVTDAPQLQEMAYSDGILLLNPGDEEERILSKLENFKLDGVLVSTDTDLLSMQHKIASRFNLLSVGENAGRLGNDKFAWREALTQQNVPQPLYSTDPKVFEGKPCIRKPRMGWSSKGVKALGAEDDKVAFSGPEFFFEAVLQGEQYNYEGIVKNKEVHILARMLDQYREHNGAIVPHYYFLNPPINPEREAVLSQCTIQTLNASDVSNGAFHLEMRMKGEDAFPIDFANRIGAGERAVSFSIGCNLGEAHASCFLRGSQTPKTGKIKPMIQVWCWTEEEFELAQSVVREFPEWVFDSRMQPHEMNGEPCYGTVVLYHENYEGLLEISKQLNLAI